jgi:twitching motility protein PilT
MTPIEPGAVSSARELTLHGLLTYAASLGASDLFLKTDSPPALKRHGRIEPTTFPTLSEEDARRLAYEQMREDQKAQFEREHELNLSFTVPSVTRIRQNVYQQRDTVATTCRLIPLKVKSLSDLGIESKAIRSLTEMHNGLVLVTGPTGSGKSTTLAAMIDFLNETRHATIITIEDPIEYVHPDKKAIVSQREVGIDTHSFHEALKQVLRQTPDVILIGELRDLDTLNVALQASETGHLVFATLHTSSAAETLDRISNMYQPHERAMLWLRLSVSLRGVVSQKLLRRADNTGRIAAQEIMVVTPTISKQLEDGQSADLYNAIRQDGTEGYWGMQTMNQCLDDYVCKGFITEEEALLNAGNLAELKQMLRRSAHTRVDKEQRAA